MSVQLPPDLAELTVAGRSKQPVPSQDLLSANLAPMRVAGLPGGGMMNGSFGKSADPTTMLSPRSRRTSNEIAGQSQSAPLERPVQTPEVYAKQIASMQSLYEVYTVEKTIGRGHFAKVKQVYAKSDGQRYAVKLLDKSLSHHDISDLVNEFEVLKRLKHTHIIRMIDAFDTPKHLCLVMELATGGELMHRITQEKTLYTENDARRYTKAILEAVEYMHSCDVVHRDLKPENILLSDPSDTAVIKVCDLGLSKIVPRINTSWPGQQQLEKHEQEVRWQPPAEEALMRTVCGTHKYLAPDVVRCERGEAFGYTKSIDVWGVGILLYIMLYGFNPFERETIKEMYEAILECKYVFDSVPVSAPARDLISLMLHPEAAGRITSQHAIQHEWITGAASEGTSHELKSQREASSVPVSRIPVRSLLSRFNARRAMDKIRGTHRKLAPEPVQLPAGLAGRASPVGISGQSPSPVTA